MKKIIPLILLFIIGISCNKIDSIKNGPNGIYLNEATSSNTTAVDITGSGDTALLTLTPKIVYPVNENTQVDISVDQSLIESYNTMNGTNFIILPTENYTIYSTTSVINAGLASGSTISIRFNAVDTLSRANKYILPITIKSNSGVGVINGSKTIYYTIDNSVLIKTAASLTNNFFTPNFTGDSAILLGGLTSFTYEALISANNFQSTYPFISSIMGVEGYALLRFGDASLSPGMLQFAASNNISNSTSLNTNQWYHIAAVVSNRVATLYVDGVQVAQGTAFAASTYSFIGRQFFIGKSYDTRYFDGSISECRLWKEARTADQLKTYEYRIDPLTPNLLAYWKFNEGTGNIAKDYTGHGFDATANSSVSWVSVSLPQN
ncbi:DUF1735 and LamG domain-containing protein [Rhizosphaericola mali]|nr:DUF1735 and LamG domain-containing protein [Rhizosphaericola mali]